MGVKRREIDTAIDQSKRACSFAKLAVWTVAIFAPTSFVVALIVGRGMADLAIAFFGGFASALGVMYVIYKLVHYANSISNYVEDYKKAFLDRDREKISSILKNLDDLAKKTP